MYALGDVDPDAGDASNRFAPPFDANDGASYPRGASIVAARETRVSAVATVVTAIAVAHRLVVPSETRVVADDDDIADARGQRDARPYAARVDVARDIGRTRDGAV